MTTPREPGFLERFALLREPQFSRLFWSRMVSAFGTAMAPVAMAFGVLHLTGSAQLMGVVIASQTVAQVAVQLFAGALADRWSRKRLMVGADLLAATSQSMMAVLLLSGRAEVWQLAALMAVNGIGFALHWPASVGLVPQVVERSRLQPANALLSLAQSAAFGLGGATAGVLVALAGAGWAIAVDATTFLASAWLISTLRPRAQQRAAPASLLRELRDGWREFISHRWLWAIVAQFSLVVAAWSGCFMVVGPFVADRHLGGPESWGWVAGALGLGLLVGGLMGMRLSPRRPLLVGTLCVFGFAIPLVLLAETSSVPIVAFGAFLAGVGGELFAVFWFTALHTHVAPEVLSRVSAYDILGSIALAPVGEALAGTLIEGMGVRFTLWLGATLIVIPTLAVLLVPEVRNLANPPGASATTDQPGS